VKLKDLLKLLHGHYEAKGAAQCAEAVASLAALANDDEIIAFDVQPPQNPPIGPPDS
jgi:hypothetical protein